MSGLVRHCLVWSPPPAIGPDPVSTRTVDYPEERSCLSRRTGEHWDHRETLCSLVRRRRLRNTIGQGFSSPSVALGIPDTL